MKTVILMFDNTKQKDYCHFILEEKNHFITNCAKFVYGFDFSHAMKRIESKKKNHYNNTQLKKTKMSTLFLFSNVFFFIPFRCLWWCKILFHENTVNSSKVVMIEHCLEFKGNNHKQHMVSGQIILWHHIFFLKPLDSDSIWTQHVWC